MYQQVFTLAFLTELLVSTIRMATPLLYTALGEMYSERAGMNNIGLEGIMVMGAIGSFMATTITGNLYWGIIIGALGGILINMVFAYSVISRNSNQIVMGMALNILAAGVSSYIFRSYFGISELPAKIEGFKPIAIPILSKIPVIGPVLFNHNILVYLVYLLVPVSSFVLFKTKLGLQLRAVGEHPKAADSMGVKVFKIRYIGCILGGLLGGLGGVYLALAYMNMFIDNMVAGRGFIALAAVIFGKWKPSGILFATLLFGFADALQLRIQSLGIQIPFQFMLMLPYVITMLALAGFVGKTVGPAANGINYVREN